MIREAVQADRIALGHIYSEAWKTAYRGMIPDSFLDALTDESCAPGRIREGRTLVWEEGGQVVGLAHFGPGRDEEYVSDGELQSIYVLPDCWRSGVGQKLFLASCDRLRAMGFTRMYLWTLTGNARARAFYEKIGMHPFADRTITIAGTKLNETGYEMPLSP